MEPEQLSAVRAALLRAEKAAPGRRVCLRCVARKLGVEVEDVRVVLRGLRAEGVEIKSW